MGGARIAPLPREVVERITVPEPKTEFGELWNQVVQDGVVEPHEFTRLKEVDGPVTESVLQEATRAGVRLGRVCSSIAMETDRDISGRPLARAVRPLCDLSKGFKGVVEQLQHRRENPTSLESLQLWSMEAWRNVSRSVSSWFTDPF